MDGWLETLSQTISGNPSIAPIVALLAGVLTSMTPCALSSIPLVIGYVGGVNAKEPKTSFRLSVVFSLGMAITFTILGTAASLLGLLAGLPLHGGTFSSERSWFSWRYKPGKYSSSSPLRT